MKNVKIVPGILALFLTTNVYSTIIELEERDYLVAGDGLITYDNSTGLEWLDVTFTQGLSMLEVEANASVLAGGWQWVTTNQMETMFDHVRGNPLWSDERARPRIVYPLVGLLGPTFTVLSPGEYLTKEIFGTSRNFETHEEGGETFYTHAEMKGGISLDITDSFYPNLPFPLCDPEFCVDFHNGEPSLLETGSSAYSGSWLVRNTASVPAPPFSVLLFTGLIGLAFARRKRWMD